MGQTKTLKFTARLTNRALLLFDHVLKLLEKCRDDVLLFAYTQLESVAGPFVKILSKAFCWCLEGNANLSVFLRWPLWVIKTIVGLLFVITVSAVSILTLAVAGCLAGIFGLRNLGAYGWKEQTLVWLPALFFFAFSPFFLSNYSLYRMGVILAYTIGTIGLDFLFGQCGILSFAHAGFLLIAGYCTVWLANGYFGFSIPALPAIFVSVILVSLLGALIGALSLRIKDQYLAIMTLAFSLAVPILMKSQLLLSFSGLKEGGIFLAKIDPPQFLSHVSKEHLLFFLVSIPSLLLIVFAYNILHHSYVGRAFRIIKCDNEISAIMGIPVLRYKILAFVLSAAYAGFCGGFLTLLTKFIAPESYSVGQSFDFLIANNVGGIGSILGAFLGGAFLTFQPDFTYFMSQHFPQGKDLAQVSYGVLLILTVYLAPAGLAGQIAQWLKMKFQQKSRRGTFRAFPAPDCEYDSLKSKPLERIFEST